MDPVTLANEIVTKLQPFLPYLVVGAVEGVTSEAVKGLWNTIKGKFKGRPAAEEVLKDLEKNPADQDNIAALRKELKKAMEEDSHFAEAIASILKELPPTEQISEIQVVKDSIVHGSVIQVGKIQHGQKGPKNP